eukprot:940643-Rhodomonas_salina.1
MPLEERKGEEGDLEVMRRLGGVGAICAVGEVAASLLELEVRVVDVDEAQVHVREERIVVLRDHCRLSAPSASEKREKTGHVRVCTCTQQPETRDARACQAADSCSEEGGAHREVACLLELDQDLLGGHVEDEGIGRAELREANERLDCVLNASLPEATGRDSAPNLVSTHKKGST